MPRKPKVQLAEQVYNLPQYGPEARVTISYDANRPAPPFYQPAPGVVIVGQYIAAGSSGTLSFDVPPVGDRAELEAIRARLDGRSAEPIKPTILTPAMFAPPGFDEAVQAAISQTAPISTEGADA
jgi:hypothetical protein